MCTSSCWPSQRTDHFPKTPLDVFKQLLLRALVASKFWFDVLTSIGVVVCLCLFVLVSGPWWADGLCWLGFWFGFGFFSCGHAIIMFLCSTMDRIAAEFLDRIAAEFLDDMVDVAALRCMSMGCRGDCRKLARMQSCRAARSWS